ncbi:hypothetical protein [Xanthomonas oryzae]|uniref:hypothetical protein n=1 Tax=Xanthomonas oryzae TaxID=347 RepID=UPI00197E813A|nr:hypothetical protein [Xanthomonas oryzae]
MNWTPGPWRLMLTAAAAGLHYRAQRPRCCVVCTARRSTDTWAGISDTQALTNAHLVAAAPDLYEALETLIQKGASFRETVVETRGVRGMDEHDAALSKAENALAKARGEE